MDVWVGIRGGELGVMVDGLGFRVAETATQLGLRNVGR